MTENQAARMVELLIQHAQQNDITNEQLSYLLQYVGTLIIMCGFLCVVVAFLIGYLITKGRR